MSIIGAQENCTDCGSGRYSTVPGATAASECVSCLAGKFSNATRAGEVSLAGI